MFEDIEDILVDTDTIARRVETLAGEVGRDLAPLQAREEPIVIVPILTGSLIFVADLVRHLPQKMRIDVTSVTSYPGKSTESIGASLVGDLPEDLEGRHVLIVDDIFDTGHTLHAVTQHMNSLGVASLHTAVLLYKHGRQELALDVDFIGFQIPDEFVVGYGLDYQGIYRNLPYVGVMEHEDLSANEEE